MPSKVASIPSGGGSSRFSIPYDSALGYLDNNGVLQDPSTPYSFSSADILGIGSNAYKYKFYFDSALSSVSLPNCTSVGENGLYQAFMGCSAMTSFLMPSLTTVGDNGMYYAVRQCNALTSIDIHNL